jgi:squalene-hopene/tetraprenyl-beta-curcumene cyclase
MISDAAALDRTIHTLTRRLVELRKPSGTWEGRLSSSALSTAVAIIALKAAGRSDALVRSGAEWLEANQNSGGGWGDTVISASNLSTTLLCWSAISRGEAWLREQIGEPTPQRLKSAILQRYGKDRTFSVPILSVLALSGKLAWNEVPQLPFELAACPHAWFRWLRLPVVSYAVPALVAIGQSRHHHAPTRNPITRALRSSLRRVTLAKARAMQPQSGGYLEAAPLTAFVAMNLISAGSSKDPIVSDAIRFLETTVRSDGSWPIDTDLATWVTTLSVTALDTNALPPEDWARILRQLLDQQYSKEHPFTHAMPGGWAWTHRSGGVPDADDTAGALLAIRRLSGGREIDTAIRGIQWLLDLQNRDGGIPTFCRGWGALPFDRSAPDLTAHVLKAWRAWRDELPRELKAKVDAAAQRASSYLNRQQNADGSWTPLWFGNERAPNEENSTFGTARVVTALPPSSARTRGIAWLLNTQNPDGGWGGAAGVCSSIEETGLALEALAASGEAVPEVLHRGCQWLINATEEGTMTPASPIGLYFARLWYHEELYPLVFALRGLHRAKQGFKG